MTISDRQDSSSQQVFISWLLSLFIPGAGQLYLKKYWRAISIFATTVLLAFLVNWAFNSAEIGKVTLGAISTSWLWLPLILFWVWNVLDARSLAKGQSLGSLPAVALAAIILYFLAWVVTDVKVDRLISRFDDAKKVTTDLVNPDIFSVDVNGEPQQCDWRSEEHTSELQSH